MEIAIQCKICNEVTTLVLPMEGVKAYRKGALIQDAFPTLTADERELLISKFCGKCFDDLFREDGEAQEY